MNGIWAGCGMLTWSLAAAQVTVIPDPVGALGECSSNGVWCVSIEPEQVIVPRWEEASTNRATARATMMRAGSEMWSTALPEMPSRALVSNYGHLVTLDSEGSIGRGTNVVALYDAMGRHVRSYALEELMAPHELARLPQTASGRWWRWQREPGILSLTRELRLPLLVGGGPGRGGRAAYRTIHISLIDGRVTEEGKGGMIVLPGVEAVGEEEAPE